MSKTLLEKASGIKVRTSWSRGGITDEEIELAVAWAEGRVGITQLAKVLGMKVGGNTLYRFAFALKEGFRNGKIKYTKTNK